MCIYDKIKQICDEKNLTIAAVEREAGLGNGLIATWKKGTPSITNLMKVAKVLEVALDELIKEGDE